ncbi:Uncharacterised protein [Vibrio cholerae]|nr:Uncharacterised protein [Vibrio cholerae]
MSSISNIQPFGKAWRQGKLILVGSYAKIVMVVRYGSKPPTVRSKIKTIRYIKLSSSPQTSLQRYYVNSK